MKKNIKTALLYIGAGIWFFIQQWVFGLCTILFLAVAATILSPIVDDPGAIYITDAVADYGVIKGNYDNDRPERFIKSFFPDVIDQGYSDVEYYYRAQKEGDYNFEAYLEFKVPDKEAYEALVESVAGETEISTFVFDPRFSTYEISDGLIMERAETGEKWQISNAWFGRVLFSEETQTVVYVAMGYKGDASVDVEGLDHFFTKFEIDPVECATMILD